jgi:hypothetical protein
MFDEPPGRLLRLDLTVRDAAQTGDLYEKRVYVIPRRDEARYTAIRVASGGTDVASGSDRSPEGSEPVGSLDE